MVDFNLKQEFVTTELICPLCFKIKHNLAINKQKTIAKNSNKIYSNQDLFFIYNGFFKSIFSIFTIIHIYIYE